MAETDVKLNTSAMQLYTSLSVVGYFSDEWGKEWSATVFVSTKAYEDGTVTWDEDPPESEAYDIDDIEISMIEQAYDLLHSRKER